MTTLTEEKITQLVRGRAHYASLPTLEVRDVADSGRYLEGRAVPYNTWADIGWFRERFLPGAFAKSIREAARGLPLLLWHNGRTFPIGVAEEWRDGDDGLDGVWRLDVDDPLAVEAARKARDGFQRGLSIGFAPIDKPGRNQRGERIDLNNEVDIDDMGVLSITRREARLLEVSLTAIPAYVGAGVTKVRQRDGRSAEISAWREYLDSLG